MRRPRSEAERSGCDDEYSDEAISGSAYGQRYFDGWVWVLSGRAGGAGAVDTGSADDGDADRARARKMGRRGGAKSEAAKVIKGKDGDHRGKEWTDVQGQMRNGAFEAEKEEKDGWKKRWLVVREGYLSLWLDRTEESAMVGFSVWKCVGLDGKGPIRCRRCWGQCWSGSGGTRCGLSPIQQRGSSGHGTGQRDAVDRLARSMWYVHVFGLLKRDERKGWKERMSRSGVRARALGWLVRLVS